MAILLHSNFNSNPLLPLRSLPIKFSANNNNALRMNSPPYKIITATPKTRMKCFIMNHKTKWEKDFDVDKDNEDNDLTKVVTHHSNINVVILSSLENVLIALKKGITKVLLSLILLVYDHHGRGGLALAASGGRMGGSSFSSSSRSSSTSSSSSRSSSTSSSSTSYSSPTSSYSRPNSSFESYTTQIGSPVLPTSAYDNVLDLISFVILLVMLVLITIATWIHMGYCFVKGFVDQYIDKTSVLLLQVGLLGIAKSMQKDLNRIAEVADTSTSKGLSYVLQEATLALLRNPDYCISSYSSVDKKRSEEECEKQFNKLSIEERGKFDEETLVNVNNSRKQSVSSRGSNGVCNEYIVVTIIVAAKGIHELPPIKSSAQLKEALQKLASIPSTNILAAEVLWTPQEENDSLTEQKMREDYPLLLPL